MLLFCEHHHHCTLFIAPFSLCIYYMSLSLSVTGFRAEGLHLPTPPPIPEAIAKSLQYHLNRTPQTLPQPPSSAEQSALQQRQQLNQNVFNNQNQQPPQQQQTPFQSTQASSRQYQRPDTFNSNDNTGLYDPNRN